MCSPGTERVSAHSGFGGCEYLRADSVNAHLAEMVTARYLLACFFPYGTLGSQVSCADQLHWSVSFLFEVRCDTELLYALSGETLKPSCLSEKGAAKPI